MASDPKSGTPWSDEDLDAIVADYFAMLGDELAGRPFVKSHHSAALRARIGRTHGSVEFKHQNISAVLDELGLPWIAGYIPRSNYQEAIFDAIDRHLTRHPHILEFVPASAALPKDPFVPPPVRQTEAQIPAPLQRLVRKFDPIDRDQRNRSLGKAGEEFVMEVERRRLTNLQRVDLAKKIRWVANDDGDGAGYDILSFNANDGRERLIEVKTTNGSARTPFFLTRNERAMSIERPADWLIYRVHRFAKEPRIFQLSPPLETAISLIPETWRASVGLD